MAKRGIRAGALVAVMGLVLLAAACAGGDGGSEVAPDAPETAMELQSSAFGDDEAIPVRHAREGAGGDNVSIPYEWTDAPAETRSFAFVLFDTHPVARDWVHWMITDIPADATSLAEGASGSAMPPGTRELRNTWGDAGYGGPEPPAGSGAHRYLATLYALDIEQLDIDDDAELRDFFRAIEDHVIAEASYAGVFERE